MYYNNIYFHNVDLMKKDEDGNYLLCRFDEEFLFEQPKKSKKQKPKKEKIKDEVYIPKNKSENASYSAGENQAIENQTVENQAIENQAIENQEIDSQVVETEEPTVNSCNLEAVSESEITSEVISEVSVDASQEDTSNLEVESAQPTESEEISAINEESKEETSSEEEAPLSVSVLEPFLPFKDLSLGVELRFKLVSNEVKIKLKLLSGESPALCEVYFGNYYAGKNYTLTICDNDVLEYTFKKENLPPLNKKLQGFKNDVVRILLPTRSVLYCGKEGQTEIPQEYEMPSKNIVFLGSNGFGASEVDKPSLSIAFETASKLNANSYNLTGNLTDKQVKALLPFIKSFGKSCLVVCDALTCEINDKNYRLVLRQLKKKVKILSKLKNKVLFVDYLFNYFNFKNAKRTLKVKAKISKILRKKPNISPFNSYGETMLLGVNELSAFATAKIAFNLLEEINETLTYFTKNEKVKENYVEYSIKASNEEPTHEPVVMSKAEKREILKANKERLKQEKLDRKNKKKQKNLA